MYTLPVGIVVASLMVGGTAIAKDRGANENAAPLAGALSVIATTATTQGPPPPEQFKPKKNDQSQGAAHANPGAILRVCSKDTPAAHRAAICAAGVSPD